MNSRWACRASGDHCADAPVARSPSARASSACTSSVAPLAPPGALIPEVGNRGRFLDSRRDESCRAREYRFREGPMNPRINLGQALCEPAGPGDAGPAGSGRQERPGPGAPGAREDARVADQRLRVLHRQLHSKDAVPTARPSSGSTRSTPGGRRRSSTTRSGRPWPMREAVTRVFDGHVPDEVYAEAAKHFTEP